MPHMNGTPSIMELHSKKADLFQDVRTSSPGPLADDFARQMVTKQQRNNYHSSSLKTMNVNQTSLHPQGVAYVGLMAGFLGHLIRATANDKTGRPRAIRSSRRSYVRLLISTMIELPLSVKSWE